MSRYRGAALAAGLLIVVAAAGVLCARQSVPAQAERVIAAYATSLAGRSAGQVDNALRAARVLDGAVVPAGAVFSFNRRVGPWSADRGYRRAPVSYDGEIILDVGGGVCQLSTTLYGAALVGGMEIVERHRHFWPVTYAAPGLDAAVAFPRIDLRFRNPLPAPVRLRARRDGPRLIVELRSTARGQRCSVERRQLAVHPPATLARREQRLSPGEVLRTNRGQAGQEVAVYRLRWSGDGQPERTLISVDTYPPLNRIIKVGLQPGVSRVRAGAGE
ncbi:MAG TPA: VanW family protein [Armatimonadota bacterium]|nr:VanW family protein [Armatimonadota bacterium]